MGYRFRGVGFSARLEPRCSLEWFCDVGSHLPHISALGL